MATMGEFFSHAVGTKRLRRSFSDGNKIVGLSGLFLADSSSRAEQPYTDEGLAKTGSATKAAKPS